MNVRKGTFRLWVVLSVLFVIAIAVISYSDIHTEFRNAYTDWDADFAKYGGYSLLPADCEHAKGTLGIDYERNDDGLCWYKFYDFRKLYPEYKDLSNHEFERRVYAKAGRPLTEFHPWIKVAKTAGVAFGGPFAILALGYALSWAIAGFKSQTPTPNTLDSPGTEDAP